MVCRHSCIAWTGDNLRTFCHGCQPGNTGAKNRDDRFVVPGFIFPIGQILRLGLYVLILVGVRLITPDSSIQTSGPLKSRAWPSIVTITDCDRHTHEPRSSTKELKGAARIARILCNYTISRNLEPAMFQRQASEKNDVTASKRMTPDCRFQNPEVAGHRGS